MVVWMICPDKESGPSEVSVWSVCYPGCSEDWWSFSGVHKRPGQRWQPMSSLKVRSANSESVCKISSPTNSGFQVFCGGSWLQASVCINIKLALYMSLSSLGGLPIKVLCASLTSEWAGYLSSVNLILSAEFYIALVNVFFWSWILNICFISATGSFKWILFVYLN